MDKKREIADYLLKHPKMVKFITSIYTKSCTRCKEMIKEKVHEGIDEQMFCKECKPFVKNKCKEIEGMMNK